MKKITIAIDGFSSSGKSTMAKALAKKLGYIYVDSGAMYRAVTLYAIENNLFNGDSLDVSSLKEHLKNIDITFQLNPETSLPETYLNGRNVENKIRTMEVSSKVSIVSAVGFVREAMVALQQKMGTLKGIVMDGRDIGTTVFPNAELKVFVTASPETRAKRRYKEMAEKGYDVDYEDILENVRSRDEIDQNREVSPLKQAEDAVTLDNGEMTVNEQEEWLLERFNEAMEKWESND